jgi:D-sedoheptulose 7-phosphate isomerase
MSFSSEFLKECIEVIEQINSDDIEKVVEILSVVQKSNGRLFIVGSGGGAGNASHAVCDFRKICGIEAYAPYDNISELTARVNDQGWESTITEYLKVSNFNQKDCLFVFSVGGGSKESKISENIVKALELAVERGAKIVGIVGKDGGLTKDLEDAVIVIPTINKQHITPITEGFQAMIWHLLVSHPKLKLNKTTWEFIEDKK